jgi:butyryl-CoA dehydrogenase/short/branched chain acyl-CoA dehydrogenase
MPETLQLATPAPLTTLTEDEILFRDSVRQFADDKIRPLAKEMDEKAVFDHALIDQFFQLGLMGIEIPEQYGGAGGKFFEAILAVEEFSRADASAGVIVDVQNTLVANAILRWASEEQKKRYLPKMAADTLGAYALSEAGSGSDAFALQTKAELKGSDFVLNGRKLWITNGKEAGLFILFATVDASKGYKGITAFLIEKSFPGISVGKKEDKLGIRASSTCELILGIQNRDRNAERRPHRNRRANAGSSARRMGVRGKVRAGADAIRQADCGISGHPVPDCADGNRDRGGAADGL